MRRFERRPPLHDRRIEALVDPRHGDDDGRTNGLEVVGDELHRTRESDRRTGGDGKVVAAGALEHVRQRQERQEHVPAFSVQPLCGRLDVGEDVGMREHDPLRSARRAGGVHQGREIVRVDRRGNGLALDIVRPVQPRVEINHAPVRRVGGRAACRNHPPQRGADVARRRDRSPALEGIDDQGDRARVP